MKNYQRLGLLIFASLAVPSPLFAASCGGYSGAPQTFSDFVCLVTDLALTAIPIVAGCALLVFFWGLAKFILKAGEEKEREAGKEIMKWGIVALFVMVSVWGIVYFLTSDIFGIRLPRLQLLPTDTY